MFSSFHKGNNNNTFVNLWKGCFWKLRSYPIDQLRNLLSTRFRPFEGILRAISSRKMREERRKEGGSFEIETGSDQIGSIARDGADSSREKEEREREGNFEENRGTKREKRRRHRRDIPYFTNEISFHEGSCVTREQSLSSVYIRAYGVSRMRCLARLNFHRKFGNTLIIGSLLSRYLICNAIFVGRREYSG